MRPFILALPLAAGFALAAGAADAPPKPPAETQVKMTMLDLQVSLIAIQNAGAACDAGVKPFCQIIAAREGTVMKLGAAVQALQTSETK